MQTAAIKMSNTPSEREIYETRGKMSANVATQDELNTFLEYVDELIVLVEEASMEDFYGTEGYERRLGWE